MIASIKFMYGLISKCCPFLLLSVILIIVILIIQLSIQISSSCDLKELYERGTVRTTDNKCPIGSYIVINLKNIMIIYLLDFVAYLLLTNIHQFVNRRRVHYFVIVILSAWTFMKCYFQTITSYRASNEYIIVLILSIIVFSLINKHNIGFIAYRFI